MPEPARPVIVGIYAGAVGRYPQQSPAVREQKPDTAHVMSSDSQAHGCRIQACDRSGTETHVEPPGISGAGDGHGSQLSRAPGPECDLRQQTVFPVDYDHLFLSGKIQAVPEFTEMGYVRLPRY